MDTMPRAVLLYTEFFYEPLTEDVDELLARFQQTDSVRYEVFSAIWRDMSFSDVFRGMANMSEMKRFCRVALATAVKYFLPPYSFQIRVGGLYLMFAFYHCQPSAPPVKIRLALEDWPDVQRFVKESAASNHHDVVYIYQKLVATKAIHYVAVQHFLTFQKQRKPKKEATCAAFVGRSEVVQELLGSDILEEMEVVQNQYEKFKKVTEVVRSQLTVTHPDFVSSLKAPMSAFITWQQKTFSRDNGGDGEARRESGSRAELLSSIKSKSYGNFREAPRSRRHRQTETADSFSSGSEQMPETAPKKRPSSLRARTWRSLGVPRDESRFQTWLLSVPEEHDGFVVKRNVRGWELRLEGT